jgi:hypothetical protein
MTTHPTLRQSSRVIVLETSTREDYGLTRETCARAHCMGRAPARRCASYGLRKAGRST